MARFRARLLLVGLVGLLTATSHVAGQPGFALAAGTVSLQNDFIRVYVGEQGMFTIGTGLNDPQNPADDEKILLLLICLRAELT